MNDSERRRYEMLVRVKQFGIENSADFPPASVGALKFALVGALVDEIESEAAKQSAGFSEAAQQFEVKSTARENLRDAMSDISRTSKSMEYEYDGIGNKFRFQRNLSDVELLALSRAFATEATPYQADFVAYGLANTFITDLSALSDAFEQSFANTSAATGEHVAATAETSETIRQAMIAVRTVDGIVRNRYANNIGKLAAWLSASHVEKPPKKKTPPPTP